MCTCGGTQLPALGDGVGTRRPSPANLPALGPLQDKAGTNTNNVMLGEAGEAGAAPRVRGRQEARRGSLPRRFCSAINRYYIGLVSFFCKNVWNSGGGCAWGAQSVICPIPDSSSGHELTVMGSSRTSSSVSSAQPAYDSLSLSVLLALTLSDK